jgi:lipopolysaccharide/colanic/teichoic acid biosynthesis glycosyltransferase
VLRTLHTSFSAPEPVLLTVDTAVLCASFWAAISLYFDADPTVYLLYDGGAARIAFVIVTMIVTMCALELYSHVRLRSRVVLAQQFLIMAGVAMLAEAFLVYIYPDARLPILVMTPATCVSAAVLFAWRVVYSKYVLRVIGGQRIVFLGINSMVRDIAARIAMRPDLGLEIVGYVCDTWPEPPPVAGKHLGPVACLKDIVTAAQPESLVVGLDERRSRTPVSDLLALRLAGFHIEDATATYETVYQRISLGAVRPSELLYAGELWGPSDRPLWELLMDYGLALSVLLASAPLLLVAALALKLKCRGPVLFRETRVGRKSEAFRCLRLRGGDGSLGRVLRRTGIDTLPQLWNVLRGEMAIVGPRADRPEDAAMWSDKIPFYRQRYCVRPGITGWAQINLQRVESLKENVRMLEYDLYYVKNNSWRLRFFVILQSFVRSGIQSR